MMSLAIDTNGHQLIGLARIGLLFAPGQTFMFGTFCPACGSLAARMIVERQERKSFASIVCECGLSRIVDVDAPGAVGSQP